MRYLLLSILVVSLVGVLVIPSAFAETHIVTIEYDNFLNENADHPWSKLGEITGCYEYSGTYGTQSRTVCFSPHVLTILDGDTVTWINNTEQDRTVTFSDARFKMGGPDYEDIKDESDSGYISPGDSFSRTFYTDPTNMVKGVNMFDYIDIVGQTRAQEYDVGNGLIIIGCLSENSKFYSDFFHPRPEYCAQAVEEVDTEPAQQGSGGCGEGTVMVNGVCQLADNSVPDAANNAAIGLLVVIGIPVIIIIIVVILIKRRKKTTQPARQELDEYEEQYIEEEEPRRKPARQIETSAFCDNCGKKLKPTAKFCGGCGNQV